MGSQVSSATGRAISRVEGAYMELTTPVAYWLPREEDEPLEQLTEKANKYDASPSRGRCNPHHL